MKTFLNFCYIVLRFLPLTFYYFVADCFFYISYYAIGYRRPVVRKNISLAFPDKSLPELKSIEKRFYRHLADYIVESAAMIRLKKEDYAKRYRYLNHGLISDQLKAGKNVLLVSGHYGNWEWICSLPLIIGDNVFALYKEQSNQLINEAMLYAREKNGMGLLTYPQVYREILRSKGKKVLTLFMLSDQRPLLDHKAEWIDFLNQPVTYFRGLENLSREMNGSVFYSQITKVKRGHYTMEFIPLVTDEMAENTDNWLTKTYFKILEKNISIDPAFYLWSHNRWKFTKPTAN
ncbi:MAG: lysophospholipid acyltransferase family protein [bacterium]